jgi:hypothetical protein
MGAAFKCGKNFLKSTVSGQRNPIRRNPGDFSKVSQASAAGVIRYRVHDFLNAVLWVSSPQRLV